MEENKAKIYDFTQLEIEVEFSGKCEVMDLSKPIANEIHMGTADIGIDELARIIYHEGKAEIPDPMVRQQMIDIIMASRKIVPIKLAVKKLLEE